MGKVMLHQLSTVNIIGHNVIFQISILIRITIHDIARGTIIRVVLAVNQIAIHAKKNGRTTQANTCGSMKEIRLIATTQAIGIQAKTHQSSAIFILRVENHDQNLNTEMS
jgi:hypothetical protein